MNNISRASKSSNKYFYSYTQWKKEYMPESISKTAVEDNPEKQKEIIAREIIMQSLKCVATNRSK